MIRKCCNQCMYWRFTKSASVASHFSPAKQIFLASSTVKTINFERNKLQQLNICIAGLNCWSTTSVSRCLDQELINLRHYFPIDQQSPSLCQLNERKHDDHNHLFPQTFSEMYILPAHFPLVHIFRSQSFHKYRLNHFFPHLSSSPGFL